MPNGKISINDCIKYAEFFKGKLLSTEYKYDKDLEWKCNEGHIFYGKWRSIKQNSSWCPYCKQVSNKSEMICRLYLEEIFGEMFPKTRPNWLKNKQGRQLELDGFCQKLNLAFEHQGIQHYTDISLFSREDFSKRLENDKIKSHLCDTRNVKLIVIPELVRLIPLDKLREYLQQEFKRLNIIKIINNIFDINTYASYFIENNKTNNNIAIKVKEKCDEKEGICYTKLIINWNQVVNVKCKHNHTWKTTATKLIHSNNGKGSWCKECHTQSQRCSILDLILFAHNHGGELISKEYKRADEELLWKCQYKHQFLLSWDQARINMWCSICRPRKRNLTLEFMKNIANQRGGECLSVKYVNIQTPLTWKCGECKTIWDARANSIITKNSWCPKCAGNQKLTIEDMKELAIKMGGKCLSNEYINSREPLEWECGDCGYIWKTRASSVKHDNHWCPNCNVGGPKRKDK